MPQSYASLLRFQGGWSSLQMRSRAPHNTYRGLTLQTGMLGNLQARITSKMCSKNFLITSDCGSWVSWHGPDWDGEPRPIRRSGFRQRDDGIFWNHQNHYASRPHRSFRGDGVYRGEVWH